LLDANTMLNINASATEVSIVNTKRKHYGRQTPNIVVKYLQRIWT